MVRIDDEKCVACGRCLDVCPDYVLVCKENSRHKREILVRHGEFCCDCGQCVAVCPSEAMTHGQYVRADFKKLDPVSISPESMMSLIYSRRSTRCYKPDPVPDEVIDQLIEVATHAGTGSNYQAEGLIVIQDQRTLEKLDHLAADALWNAGLKYLDNRLVVKLVDLKDGREAREQYQHYFKIMKHRRGNGDLQGMVLRNAPAVILVHGPEKNYMTYANCALAVRNMELMALTMGLATCWAGLLIAAAQKSTAIHEYLGLPRTEILYGAIMTGYPKHRINRKIPRKPRNVRRISPLHGNDNVNAS